MSVKRFTGRNITEVMRQVRTELGDDAVLLSNRKIPGGVEVVAMSDEGLKALEESQSSAPRAVATAQSQRQPQASAAAPLKPNGKPATESLLSFEEQLALRKEMREQEALQTVQPLANPFRSPAPEPYVAPAPAASPLRKSLGKAAYNNQANDLADADDLGATEVRVNLSSTRTQQAPVATPTLEPEPELEVFEAELVDDLAEPEPSGPVLPTAAERFAEDLRKATAITEWSSQMVGDLNSMQDLIRRQILPRVSQSTVYAEINQLLAKAGFQKDLCEQMLSSLPGELAERRMDRHGVSRWIEHALTERISVMGSPDVWWGGRIVLAAIGSNGIGKTTTISKLAARFVMENSPSEVVILTTDSEHSDTLRNHAEVMGIDFQVIADYQDLDQTIKAYSYKRVVLVDTPGLSYRHKKLGAAMARLAQVTTPLKVMLVISASSEAESLEAMTGAYKAAASAKGLDLADCIVTKLDEAVRIGALISIMARHQLRVNYQSSGSGILEDFERGSALELVRHSMECYSIGDEVTAVDGTKGPGEQFDIMRNKLLDNVGEMTQILTSIRREFKNAGFAEGTRSIGSTPPSRKSLPYGQLIEEQRGTGTAVSNEKPALLWAKNDYQVDSAYFSLSSAHSAEAANGLSSGAPVVRNIN